MNASKNSTVTQKSITFFDNLGSSSVFETDPVLNYEQRVRRFQIFTLLRPNGGFILDAGCGAGRDTQMIIASTRAEYVGVDLSPASLRKASQKKFKRVNLVRADLTHLPFKTEIFDQILCSEVLEHIPIWESAITEYYRVLKPNMTLIVSTPNTFSLYYPQKVYLENKRGSKHPYDEWKNYWVLKDQLNKRGFKVITVKGACMLPGLICYTGIAKKIITPALPLFEKLEHFLFSIPLLKHFAYICILASIKPSKTARS